MGSSHLQAPRGGDDACSPQSQEEQQRALQKLLALQSQLSGIPKPKHSLWRFALGGVLCTLIAACLYAYGFSDAMPAPGSSERSMVALIGALSSGFAGAGLFLFGSIPVRLLDRLGRLQDRRKLNQEIKMVRRQLQHDATAGEGALTVTHDEASGRLTQSQ